MLTWSNDPDFGMAAMRPLLSIRRLMLIEYRNVDKIFRKKYHNSKCWLVGCFGFNGPLRQYFSLYRAVSQREGERGERIYESKNVQTTPPAPTARAVGPCPTISKV